MNIYLILGLFAAGLITGWRAEVWHQSYVIQKEEVKVIDKLGEGQSNIIRFNQEFSKVKTNEKDCANMPIPSDYIKLLR